MDESQLPETIVESGARLLNREDDDAYSFLGIQSERLEIAQSRQRRGMTVPTWSDADAIAKVLSDQRAPRDELKRYAAKGRAFAESIIEKISQQLRSVLCEGSTVRPQVQELESDTKTLIRYLAAAIIGALSASLPGAVLTAAAAIATTLAVILIKNNLQRFCQVGGCKPPG